MCRFAERTMRLCVIRKLAMISPVIAATLFLKPRGALTLNQARGVDALKWGSQTFAVCASCYVFSRDIS